MMLTDAQKIRAHQILEKVVKDRDPEALRRQKPLAGAALDLGKE